MAKSKTKTKTNSIQVLSLNKIQTKFPGAGLASNIDAISSDVPWLPSRSLPLTYSLGGGVPYGKIVEVYGEESSGKTLLALDFGSVAQSLGGVVMLNDAEQAFTTNWAIQNGLDPDRIYIYRSTAIEKVSDWLMYTAIALRSKLTHNEPIVFIQDSIAALDSLANINSTQSDDKAEMGNRAKAIYKMVRIRNEMLSDLGVISIYVNQLRKKLNSQFEDPDTTPGGMAMRFYASQRIGMYAGKQIKGSIGGFEERIGTETSIRIKKNKVAPPKPTFKAKIYFNELYEDKPIGLDKYFGLGELFLRTGLLHKKGNSVYYGDERVSLSEGTLDGKLEKNSKLRKTLIDNSAINTISKTRVKLESLTVNKYPVVTKEFKSQLEEEENE